MTTSEIETSAASKQLDAVSKLARRTWRKLAKADQTDADAVREVLTTLLEGPDELDGLEPDSE
jgi:hypothetical protein